VPRQRRVPRPPARRHLPHLRAGRPLRWRVLPADEEHGRCSSRPRGSSVRSGLGAQCPAGPEQHLRPLEGLDRPSEALLHLPAGPGRPRPRGDHQGSRARIVLAHLLRARCCSTDLLRCSCHLHARCCFSRADRRRGGRGRRRRGRSGGGGGTGGPASGGTSTVGGRRGAPTPAPAPAPAPAPGGTPWPSFSNPWSGRISMWPFQGPGGGPRPQLQPAAMFTGAAPLFALSWTPSAQPSQQPTWPGGWDQAALAQSFSTMGLTPPVSTEWIADSSASFHTTPDAGILSSVQPPYPSCPSSIMVGDGSCLPVTAVGSAPGSFRLPNVLVAPQIVHNILSIRQFTTDNSYSVEFDSFGLTVKDSASRRPLLRCDSPGL